MDMMLTQLFCWGQQVLSNIKEDFAGRFVYFSARRRGISRRGQEMVEAGVMDGVDYVTGLHVADLRAER